jgi:hypothetical protein
LSGNEDRSSRGGASALRRYLTGGDRVRSVITLVVVGCAAALFLTAVTGALAGNKHDNKGKDARCVAGGCPGPNPFGYPLGAQTISQSILALPSPPETREEVFYAHGTPAGATNVFPGAPAVLGEGSDIFAVSTGGPGPSFPADLQKLTGLPQAAMIPFLLRDANDKVIGFAVEMEMRAVPGTTTNNTFASDWIVSIPGRGVLWLNSNDNTGSPDLPITTLPDGTTVTDTTTGPAPGGNGRGVIVGGSGEFANRTGTWDELDIKRPGYPTQLGTFEFEMHVYWDQKPKKSKK